jgi:hypothetical protein
MRELAQAGPQVAKDASFEEVNTVYIIKYISNCHN